MSGDPGVPAGSWVAEIWCFLWKRRGRGCQQVAQCWEVISERRRRSPANGGSTLTKLLCQGRMDNNWKILSSFRDSRAHIDA